MLSSRTNTHSRFALRKLTFVMGGLLAASQAWSQGVISGRVADANGSALPGAQIQIQGQNVRGTTNNQGEFTLPQVPAGNHTLVIEYLGYSSATQSVSVVDGQRANASFTLQPAGASSLEEVVVIARPIADGQARALNQQRMADNISNVISADAIGRFPDTNIAEALQRTPGIGIERDQGEGRYINVRGAPAEFSAVAIDGVSLPAPDPTTRAVDLDTIPSDIVSQIEVSKTLQPQHDADSIAGAVNIVTRSPFDTNGPQLRASGGSSYNEMGGKSDTRATLLASDIFGAQQEFGGLFSLSYSKTRRQLDNVESGWAVVDTPEGGESFGLVENLFKDYDTRRERMAATGMLEWRPTDTDSFFVRGSWARFTDDEFRNRLSILWDGEGTLQPGSTDLSATYTSPRIEKQFRRRVQENDISSIQFGGKHELGIYTTDYTASFSRAEQTYPNRDELLFRNSLRPTLSYDFRSNPKEPAISLFNTNEHLQVDRYSFRENTFRSNDAVEDEVSLMGNIEFPAEAFDGVPVTYRFGVKYRGRDKDHDEERWRDRRAASAPTLSMVQLLSGQSSSNYGYNLGSKFESDLVQAYLDSQRANSERRMPQSITADYNVEEDILAFYGQGKFDLSDTTDVVIGLRIEQTDLDALSYGVDEDTGAITTRVADNSYTDLFPGITVRHEFSDQLIGRAAITRAINRPNFPDLVPRLVESDETVNLRRISSGNPDLKPTMTTNLDLMLEYYMEPIGILSGGLFYKDLEDYRFTLTRNGEFEGANAIISRPENAPDGRIYGAEINWQQQLTMLPGWLAGFGYMFNYTYTDAEMDLAQAYNGRQTFALTNQSKTNWNAALFYENYGFSARLSYTDRSDFIDEINVDNPDLDLYWQGRSQLDLTASYQAGEQWEVFFEGKNLSDTAGLRFYGTSARVYEYEQFGAIYFLGVRYNH